MKKLGFISILFLSINGIIGTGIFALPAKAYLEVGPFAIVMLLLCACFMAALGLTYAEAGGQFDRNGSAYVYTIETMGRFPGYIVGFFCSILAIVLLALFPYFLVSSSLAGLGATLNIEFLRGLGSNPGATKVISIVILIVLGIVNLCGVNLFKVLNNSLTIAKLVPLILLCIIGFFFIKGSNYTPFIGGKMAVGEPGVLLASFLVLFYAFTGFESLAKAASDFENPKKNVPKAVIITAIIVTIIYFFVLVVTIGILGEETGNTLYPLVEAANRVLPALGLLVAVGATISMSGITIAESFLAPRSLEALAQDKFLPRAFAAKENGKMPAVTIFVTYGLAILLILSGGLWQLITLSVITRFLQFIPTCIAVFILRKKNPNNENFKNPFGLTIPIIALCLSLGLFIVALQADLGKFISGSVEWYQSSFILGIIVMIVASTIYFLTNKANSK